MTPRETETGDKEKLLFGPDEAQWIYDPNDGSWDLSRGGDVEGRGKGRFGIEVTEGAGAGGRLFVNPGLSALVIVDMQNFFLSERCRQHPLGLAAVEPTIQVIKKCRQVGIQVIWLNWGLTDTDMLTMPAGVQKGFSRTLISSSSTPEPKKSGLGADLGDGKGRTLFEGSWNADIYPPLKDMVGEGDMHCAKNRMSGMWSEEQPLWKYLSGKEGGGRKETLFFTGVNTDQCVLGTLTDAYNAGWDCVMINDCCATTTEKGKEVCVYNISRSYGFVVDSSTFCAGTLD